MKTYDRRMEFITCFRSEFFLVEVDCNLSDGDWWPEFGPQMRYVGVNYNLDKKIKQFCFKLVAPEDSFLKFTCKNAAFEVLDSFEIKVVYDENPQ